jgi:SAM-dependent methyltransferase
MIRLIQPELLDELPASDPRAIGSRRDLRRINFLMGNARAITRFIKRFADRKKTLRIAEIGAGDGNISLRIARAFPSGELILVDRNPTAPPAPAGWTIHVEKADVFEWIEDAPRVDVIVANLFLHHFDQDSLRELLDRCARRCDGFVAAEPRRNAFASWFAGRVGLIGCNEVTRHDAVISVRAGFNGAELSELWPKDDSWIVTESRHGLFTHFFSAERRR